MLNKIIIMGRLGKDPELRHTQSGTPVASFSLAVDRDFKDKGTGERVTDWIDVVAWRQPILHQRPCGRGGGAPTDSRLDRPWGQQAPFR